MARAGSPRRAVWRIAALCAGLALSAPLAAQDTSEVVQSPILLIDSEEAFARSDLGQSIATRMEDATRELAAENRRIEAELIEEEKSLTEKRKAMEAVAFRALADAFDEKVRRIRSEQDAKARALGQQGDEGRREFLTAARPVLEEIMRESGAAVILETRDVFLGAEGVNITSLLIERLNATADAGEAAIPAPGAPVDTPADTPEAPAAETDGTGAAD